MTSLDSQAYVIFEGGKEETPPKIGKKEERSFVLSKFKSIAWCHACTMGVRGQL